MPKATTLDHSRFEVKLGNYSVGPATALSDSGLLAATQEYRRQASSRMMPISQADIETRIPSGNFLVSRKLDGEFSVLVYRDGEAFTLNPGGTVRTGLPLHNEAAKILAGAGVDSALIAGELHVRRSDGTRSRVHDVSKVARSPQSEDDLSCLAFAPFDLISLNEEKAGESYAENFQTLENLFADAELCTVVETQVVSRTNEISALFRQWVEGEDAEGLVVRSDESGTYKVKPQHSLDVVVVGFTESTGDRQGLLHDLLVAVRRSDGSHHVLTRVGGGFSEDQRRTMLSDLKDMVVDSEFIEVNSDYVAYQMVRPEWVCEITCLDLISQTTRGGPVNRMIVDYTDDGFKVVRRLPLATVISPQFVRLRDDKTVEPALVSISQISDRVEVEMVEADAKTFRLPTSEVVKREVFTKVLKGETMVRKFVIIKTNKEDVSEDFPAFVLHYTDFSPNRKDPLAREIIVSSSEAQIQSMFLSMKEKNIKKGWQPA
ncbi:MAG: hypothetical protein Aurels2KO_51370 [Aureliella sp.]